MNLYDLDWTGVTIKAVTETQRTMLKLWRINVMIRENKRGLWIYGPRNAGTTFAAKSIVHRLVWDDEIDVHHIEADQLVQMLKKTWLDSSQVRAHSDDIALWQELQDAALTIEYLLDRAPVLWIDDLHHDDIDWTTWRKNFQPRIERRVKHGMPTIVCTTLPPTHSFLPKGVIDTLFLTVAVDDATR